jgi:hypothetical protein
MNQKEIGDTVDLLTRTARCYFCQTEVNSSQSLPFFEYRGEGSRPAAENCKHCGYFECAHDPAHLETLVHNRDGSRRPTVVEDGRCPGGFEPRGGVELDSYYCGCRGWD